MPQTASILYANIGAEDLRSATELHQALATCIRHFREELRPMVQIAVSVDLHRSCTVDQKLEQIQKYAEKFLQAFVVPDERFFVETHSACEGVIEIQVT